MLLGLQNGDQYGTKLDHSNYINCNKQNHNLESLSIPIIQMTNKQRISKVLSSKALLEHILSYIPIESLCSCAYVNHNWYLIIKYIVPIPLIHLKLKRYINRSLIIFMSITKHINVSNITYLYILYQNIIYGRITILVTWRESIP